jgi:CubicO group peptidase (beta-lactamase class C family)
MQKLRPRATPSLVICGFMFLICVQPAFPQTCAVPGASWAEDTSQQKAHWSPEKLALARQYADSIHSQSVMVVQNGRVVDEWGDTARKIAVFSVRKSFISALYGIYSEKGAIDINQTLEQAGIDDAPDPLTKEERQARIVDLLRARSGIYHPVDYETASMKKYRPERGSHAPGTFWFYNNWDFNAVGTIFEKKTGQKIGDAFAKDIARPIGMQDFQPSDVYNLGGPISVHRAYNFEVSARDMARFGELYLCGGRWNGSQIVPADWVAKSSHGTEMITDHGKPIGGYEYLWWVEVDGVHLPEVNLPGMFSARGAGGHYILVLPTLNMVIVHRFDNEPRSRKLEDVEAAADGPGIGGEQFGHLVKLILDAYHP